MRAIRRTTAILLGVCATVLLILAAGRTQKTVALTTGLIKVAPSQTEGEISPYIYGASVEWTENGNRILDPATHLLRPEIMKLLQPLHIPVWRFPGGILADYYHWQDGVGPAQQRPKRANPMDGTTNENSFGTDEFIEFCKTLGSDPLITANFGTGTVQEALAWQKYFSDKGLPIKFWEVGNEIYLAEPKEHATIAGNDQRIYKTAQQYASGFSEWSNALRAADPKAQVGAIAGTYNTSAQNTNWMSVLLPGAGPNIDFIALHNAFAPLIFGSYNYNNQKNREEAYQAMFAQAMFSAEDTHRVALAAAGARTPAPRIAITEHFPLFGGSPKQVLDILDQSRTLASALYTGSLFQAFMREHVWMANYNIAVSKWFGALLTDTDAGIIRTPTYYLFDLYRNHFGSTLVNVQTSSPVFSTKSVGTVKSRDDVPYLDAVASVGQGDIYLAVINRNLSQETGSRISVDGLPPDAAADVTILAGNAPNAINGTSLSSSTQGGSPDSVTLRHSSWNGVNRDVYSFPPASVTVFKWKAPTAGRKE